MVITLQRRGRMRIWINEVPHARLDGDQKVDGILMQGDIIPQMSFLAIEWKLPHGGMASYGMIGGKIDACNSPRVSAVYTKDNGRPFGDALVQPPADHAFITLPKEFATAVVNGIVNGVASIGGLKDCRLSINVGASGVVGSSIRHFSEIGNVYARLLTLSSAPRIEEIEVKLLGG